MSYHGTLKARGQGPQSGNFMPSKRYCTLANGTELPTHQARCPILPHFSVGKLIVLNSPQTWRKWVGLRLFDHEVFNFTAFVRCFSALESFYIQTKI